MTFIKKLIFAILLITSGSIFGQSKSNRDWQLENPDSSNFYGTAVNYVYSYLIQSRISTTIIVAVLDIGTDTLHEDLADQLWINPKEIAGNGIDDDNNGYVDDIHGWNFLGSSKGNTTFDNFELTRLYKLGQKDLPTKYSWKHIKNEYWNEVKTNNKDLKFYNKYYDFFTEVHKKSGSDSISLTDLSTAKANGIRTKYFKKIIYKAALNGFDIKTFEKEIIEQKKLLDNRKKYHLNLKYDGKAEVHDNFYELNESNYGNSDITGHAESHGTHVAGIIAAKRNNKIGIDGIADNVKIMTVRIVPNGDERDKDIANGIRYAVDNGAKLINMSFGKPYSPNESIIHDAIQYANSKNVLIIHACGNESDNNDLKYSYPNPFSEDKKYRAVNWIEVGASTFNGDPAYFSNYGKSRVDVFAPGVSIYSTIPKNEYEMEDGTSMASPVVCGIAALVWSYFPTLSSNELKIALLAGVIPIEKDCPLPGKPKKLVKYSSICGTGGIINAKNAFLKAEEIFSKK